jgi:hypothetical protein
MERNRSLMRQPEDNGIDSLAAEPERLRKSSEIRSLQAGELTVTYLPDGMVKLKPAGFYPGTTAEDWARSGHYLDSAGFLTASSGALPIECPPVASADTRRTRRHRENRIRLPFR